MHRHYGLQLFFEVTANTLVHRRSTLLLPQEGHFTFFESNLAIGRRITEAFWADCLW